jgi:lipid-binding SYLF domain-containing protein
MKAGLAVLLLSVVVVSVGCAPTRPQTLASRDLLSMQVDEAIGLFKARDPGIQTYFDRSYAYAVLPKVTKGAVMVGGAFGRGQVYVGGAMAGYCTMSQASLGFSFGGQYFREIIFFQDKTAFDRFTMDDFTMSAQVTAVALTSGAASKTDYQFGVAVFIVPDQGLMVDASVGGQKFRYEPTFILRDETPTVIP